MSGEEISEAELMVLFEGRRRTIISRGESFARRGTPH
jgi:hypothetical protein